MRRRQFGLAIGGALLPWAAAGADAAAPRRPLEHFAALPMVRDLVLSPDGRRVAMVTRQGARSVVAVRPVAQGPLKPLLSVDDAQAERIRWLRWVADDRLLLSIEAASRRGFVGTLETRLVALPAEGGPLVDLSQVDRAAGRLGGGATALQLQDEVVDWLPGDGRAVLVQLRRPEDRGAGVYRVDVGSGRRERVQGPSPGARRWFTDASHRVRVGVFEHDDGEFEVRGCEPDGSGWRTLWRFGGDLGDAVWPLGFGSDAQRLFVQAPHEGRRAVFEVWLDDPALPRRLLLSHDTQDVQGGLLRVPASGEVIGLLDGTDDGPATGDGAVWAPAWAAVRRALAEALPRQRLRFTSLSHDGGRYVLLASGNGVPPAWYVGDRDGGRLALLAETFPELAAAPGGLRGKQRQRIVARDGQPLNVLLSLPAGRAVGDGGAPLPMVLLPHGGPAARDDDDFDPWTEFLADRGYLVLQVNFRGSAGYGHAFLAAGLRRWGLEMQDDLTDAVQWAVDQRLADPARLGVVGASYGGYAALMAAVKTPALFRCAAGFGGVYDLPAMVLHAADYVGGRARAERSLGDGWRDRERLRETSPALQAARIRVPVLLVHGSDDRVVPVDQSRRMAEALRGAGGVVDYLEQAGGDHHLSRQADRSAWFSRLESFLDRHLAAR